MRSFASSAFLPLLDQAETQFTVRSAHPPNRLWCKCKLRWTGELENKSQQRRAYLQRQANYPVRFVCCMTLGEQYIQTKSIIFTVVSFISLDPIHAKLQIWTPYPPTLFKKKMKKNSIFFFFFSFLSGSEGNAIRLHLFVKCCDHEGHRATPPHPPTQITSHKSDSCLWYMKLYV